MTLIKQEWEPDAINEAGVQWWKDKHLANYTEQKLGKKAEVFIVKMPPPEDYMTRLLCINGAPVKESQTLESMACTIDILAVAE